MASRANRRTHAHHRANADTDIYTDNGMTYLQRRIHTNTEMDKWPVYKQTDGSNIKSAETHTYPHKLPDLLHQWQRARIETQNAHTSTYKDG